MAKIFRSSNPERDAEEWVSRTDGRPVLDICPVCGEAVYGGNDDYEPDDAFELDENIIHSDCVITYLKENGYKV